MAENLFPIGYENEVITPEDLAAQKPTGYLNGVSFDYETGDFKKDGMNKLLDSDGTESWRSWCINCLQTERRKHLAYSPDFGIDIDTVMRASTREESESILTRQISEALMADPYKRTAYVSEILFDWTAPDSVAVTVTVYGIRDVTIDITAYITRGEA